MQTVKVNIIFQANLKSVRARFFFLNITQKLYILCLDEVVVYNTYYGINVELLWQK